MTDLSNFTFGLRISVFQFGALETVLLVLAVATALVSLFELLRLSDRDELQARVAAIGRTLVEGAGSGSQRRSRWFHRLGAGIANSFLVGEAEQRRLTVKLAEAGIGGPGRLAVFMACRFVMALSGAALVWLALGRVEFPDDVAVMRHLGAVFGLMIGWRVPDIIVTRLVKRRRIRLETGFPDALDLLVICAEAGLGLEQAIGQVARDMRKATPEVADEFAITEAEMRVIADRRVPLEHLAQRTGLESLQGMISILNQSVRFGTPLTESLRQLTTELRMVRMSRIEERAARLSVTLLLPIMVFIMPSLFLVVCGPIVLRGIDVFAGVMGQ